MESPEKKNELLQNNTYVLLVNALIQISALLAYTQFEIFWPYYIVMALICLLIFVQTIAYPAAVANPEKLSLHKLKYQRDLKMNFLVSLAYMISCYQLYITGFTILGVIGFMHAVMLAITVMFRSIKND